MKRLSFIVLSIAAALLIRPDISRAQNEPAPAPTPTPDWTSYHDDGMSFHAPAGFLSLGQRHVAIGDLSAEGLVPLAAWIYPNKDTPRRIVIEAEAYDGSVSGWDNVLEQQLRGQFDGALFKGRQNISLKNGMPAIFATMTSGEGFNIQKFYMVLWADSARGMVLILTTQIDDIDDAKARALLSDVAAVRYPVNR